MRKAFCDSCKREIEPKRINSIGVPCHLYSFKDQCGYVDADGINVSGRHDNIDLCNACLNKAYIAFLNAIDLP